MLDPFNNMRRYLTWTFILIGIIGAAYWIKKLKEFDDKGEEDKDVTSHSFL